MLAKLVKVMDRKRYSLTKGLKKKLSRTSWWPKIGMKKPGVKSLTTPDTGWEEHGYGLEAGEEIRKATLLMAFAQKRGKGEKAIETAIKINVRRKNLQRMEVSSSCPKKIKRGAERWTRVSSVGQPHWLGGYES